MNYWNLLVVLCFLVLYLGVALVFLQLRRLREEMEARGARQETVVQQPTGGFDGQECAERIEQSLRVVEERLNGRFKALSGEMRSELDAVRGDMRFMGPPGGHLGSGATVGNAAGFKSDAYREARLLLANGIDEEQVITETGLTVEEVSLLKRIANQGQDEP